MTRSYNKNKKKKTTPLASRRLRVVLFVFFCDLLVPRVYGDANCSVPTTHCLGGVTCYTSGECPDGEGSACRCNRYWTGNQCHKEVENIEDCDVGNHYCLNNGQCISGLASCTCKRKLCRGTLRKGSHQVRRIPSGEVLRKRRRVRRQRV